MDHFWVIPMGSKTMDIMHSADIYHYDITIKAMKILQSTTNY